MAKRRKAIPVTLTAWQRQELENLWFIYGNHGPKTTPGNHGFIQGLIEHGMDFRPLKNKYSDPTPECEEAVEKILTKREASAEQGGYQTKSAVLLRLLSNPQR